jgi:hypothetical protein
MSDLFKYSPSLVEFRYREDQKYLVYNALKTLFSLDHRVFSGGIYIYFSTEKLGQGDFNDIDILYVGETDSYSRRFKNHNSDEPLNGNKRTFVDEYFKASKHLGLYIFAFKRTITALDFKEGEEAEDHEHDCVLLDEDFREHRHHFERILVREFKNVRGIPPRWFNDKERRTFSGDEAMLQSVHFIKRFYGNDEYALDFYLEDGFDLAQKMQESVFNPHPLSQ